MSNILKLVQLDKALLKPYYKYFLVVIIAPVVSAISYRNIISGIVFAMSIIAMTSNYTFTVTEKNDLNRLYGLLPVSKKDIVTGRYIFTAILGLSLLVILVVLNSIVLTIAKVSFTFDEILLGIGVGIIIYSVFTAIQLPAYFRFGALKGRAFSFIPLSGLFIVGLIADKISPTSVSNVDLPAIFNSPIGLLICAILLAVVLYGISLGLAQRIYDRMEF